MIYWWQRNHSKMEYIETALKISARLRQAMANASTSKYTFLGGQQIVNDAMRLHRMVCEANRLNPEKPAEAPTRATLLKQSLGLLEAIGSQFGSLHYNIHFGEGTLADMDELFRTEEAAIKGTIESDKGRLKQ